MKIGWLALRLRSPRIYLDPSHHHRSPLRHDLSPSPASRIGLQRLTQSLFQLPAIGSADSRSRTVFQDHFKFAMADRLQAKDAFDIDDSRRMDADKTNGIEPLGELVQRGPVQQFLSSDVQVRINPGSFDPVDISHPYEAG